MTTAQAAKPASAGFVGWPAPGVSGARGRLRQHSMGRPRQAVPDGRRVVQVNIGCR